MSAADHPSAAPVPSAPSALPAGWADDPFLLDESGWLRPEHVEAPGGALVAVLRTTRGTPGTVLVALGPAGAAADALRRHAVATHLFAWVGTDALGLLHAADVQRLGLHPARTGWEWLHTATPPPAVAAESVVTALDPVRDGAAIRACLADANPTTDADPAAPGERWWGVRGAAGELVGVIGAGPRAGRPGGRGSAHLHGLGVRPGERGRGLGAGLTAAAVRGLLADGADWVSLGMWDDNDGARRIYHRLGLRTVHRMTTLRRS